MGLAISLPNIHKRRNRLESVAHRGSKAQIIGATGNRNIRQKTRFECIGQFCPHQRIIPLRLA